jgi:hypothetical protein
MPMIRVAFALLTVWVLSVIDSRRSFAETYRPWCVQYSGRNGGSRSCAFTSYEQCMMTAGPGTGGSCVPNSWYQRYGPNGSSTTGRGGRARRY